MTKQFIIKCPKCKSSFDVTEYLNNWKVELLMSIAFFKRNKELFKRLE